MLLLCEPYAEGYNICSNSLMCQLIRFKDSKSAKSDIYIIEKFK